MRRVWHLHPGYRTALINNVISALYLGLVAVLMPYRFQAPTFEPLRDSLGMRGWGTILIVYGVALGCFRWLSARAACFIFGVGICVYFVIGVYLAYSMVDPLASAWGPLFLTLAGWSWSQRQQYLRIAEGKE